MSSISGVPVDQLPKYLKPKEAAELLRTTVPALATQRCLGRPTPPYVKCGKTVLYDRDQLFAWMESQTRGGGAQ
jgi:hypothetical protein